MRHPDRQADWRCRRVSPFAEVVPQNRPLKSVHGTAGIDLVEVAPPYDHAEITASLANRVVLEALSALAR